MKLIMLKGLPASGKSTYAKSLVVNNNYQRVNRDELRSMIDNGKYSPENEMFIKSVQDMIITISSKDIVVDNTNLKTEDKKHFEELATKTGRDFEIVEFTTSADECVRRDSTRENPVGAQVIYDMYERYIK